jgi:hypothetical protein
MSQEQYFQQFTFVVYTKAEIDNLLAKVDQKFAAQDALIQHQRKVFEDTMRSVLIRIESLPVELPSELSFYRQMRDRLLTDVKREMERPRTQEP